MIFDIVESNQFTQELKAIASFICCDVSTSAYSFIKTLKKTIILLKNNPYLYRKSKYFDNDNVRDMVFRGYTIVYEVDKINQQIILLSIFNKNLPDFEEKNEK